MTEPDWAKIIQEARVLAANMGWRGEKFLEAIDASAQSEHERCARIAESAVCVFGGPQIRIDTWNLCKATIADHIRVREPVVS